MGTCAAVLTRSTARRRRDQKDAPSVPTAIVAVGAASEPAEVDTEESGTPSQPAAKDMRTGRCVTSAPLACMVARL